MMNAGQYDEEAISRAALEKRSPREREGYLRSVCGGDEALLTRLEALVRAAEAGNDSLDAPDPDAETVEVSMPTEGPGAVIDRYKLLEKIGEGGMAVVYMAGQEQPLHRKVALKIIKLGMDTCEVIARFEAERQALAMMDHPNIAKVFDGGTTETGRPYFVMELVTGVSMTEYCDRNNLSTEERLRLFIEACHAVQHAHQKGVIHRDIKPSNVMVTQRDGKPVPKVIDFGIAKAINQRLTEQTLFTRYAHIIGTPAYMSPEQAESSEAGVDTRSDIYSLGVLLYELLTGVTPFSDEKLREAGYLGMQRVIRDEEPTKPSTKLSTLGAALADVAQHRGCTPDLLRKTIRGDLDWIVMKCLEKDRTRRYSTANGLAMDLARHLSDEPVVARPPSAAYRFQKAWRRNKVVYTAVAVVVMALLAGTVISVWEEMRARKNEVNALRRAYDTDMSLAFRALGENLFGRVRESVRQHVPTPGAPDFRGWEWRYAWAQCQSDAVLAWDTPAGMGRVFGLRISPDQRYMVTSGFQTGPSLWPYVRRLWNFRTREELKQVHLPGGSARGFSFSHSGDFLALHRQGENGTHEIHIYETDGWELEAVLPSESEIHSLSFSPDDKMLATLASSGALLWDWRRRTIIHRWSVHSGYGHHDVAFFPDGRRLALGGADELKIVEVATGRIVHRQPAWDEDTHLAVSPDSHYLAIGSGFEKTEIVLLNTDSWESEPLKGHSAAVTSLAFTPDSQQLLSASADHTLRVWDVQHRVTTRLLKGHHSGVHSVSLTSDVSRAVSGGADGRILEWDLNAPASPFTERVLPEKVREVVFSTDSRFFYIVDMNGLVSVWDASTFSKQRSLSPQLGLGGTIILSPDGDRLIAGAESGGLWVLDAVDLQVVAHRKAISGQIHPVGFTADGRSLVAVEPGSIISRWSVDTWQLKSRVESGLRFKYFGKERYAIPKDSDILLCVSEDTDLVWWDLAHSKELARVRLNSGGLNHAFAVAPTEPLLASIAAGDFVGLWDWKTRRPAGEVRGPRDFFSVAFSPDGRRLVSGSSGKGALRLWDVSTRQEIARLDTDVVRTLRTVQFSPDGNMICGVDQAGLAYFWRAPSFEEIDALETQQRQTERPAIESQAER